MDRNETVTAIARRLHTLRKRDVNEVLSVLLEVWTEELIRPGGYIHLDGLGKLYVEQQAIRATGVVRATLAKKHKPVPSTLNRYYFRFRPADSIHAALVAARESSQEER